MPDSLFVPAYSAPGQAPNYVPSPEEIRAACLAIQATWTPRERRVRAGLAVGVDAAERLHWTPPTIRCGKGVA